MNKFYVTTPIYYVNDVPHVGHAYSTMAADTLARFYRGQGYEVFFLTGTDEHGQKVAKAAEERGLNPQEHVDQMVAPYKQLWKRLSICYDDFIRTTEPRHEKVVAAIFERLFQQSDIYAGKYEGWYCIFEETFYPESQLKDGNCPECGRPVKWISEESYHFKTSKFMPALLKHIKENPHFILPASRRNEVVSFIESGVQDVSVSRTAFKWGVEVPYDKKHVVYVWFDALINYLSGIGYLQDEKKFNAFWPADVHIIGKDILKFHAVIWPAMLLALDLPLPKMVFAHGFLTLGGEKISKSRGKVIDPHELADDYSSDAVRYFFLREVTFGLDGEYTEDSLKRRLNFDLANDLGNLVHRSATMFAKFVGGKAPEASGNTELEDDLIGLATSRFSKVAALMPTLGFKEALEEIWELVRAANKYIDSAAPWRLAKEDDKGRLNTVMYTIAEVMRIVSLLISPFMPATAQKIADQLELGPIAKIPLAEAGEWGKIKAGASFKKEKALFPRIEI